MTLMIRKVDPIIVAEVEISMGREIAHCRKVVRRLRDNILEREKKFAMTTEEFMKSFEQDRNPDEHKPSLPHLEKEGVDSVRWREDFRDLQIWEQRLRDYEAALRIVRNE